MKTRIPLVAGFLAMTVARAAAADVSGTWSVVSKAGNPTCIFEQFGDFFRGTCEGSEGQGIAFGVIDLERIRWTYEWAAKAEERTGAFVYEGQMGEDQIITGSVKSTNGTAAAFVAKRQ